MAYFEQSFETRTYGFLSRYRALALILWMLVCVYVLQCIVTLWMKSPFFEDYIALSWPSLQKAHLWVPITYGFLHETGNLLHLVFNALIIFFTGRILESELGAKQFSFLYLWCLFFGGVVWLANHLTNDPYVLEGASAAALGLLFFFCLLRPEEPITFLFFFVLPVTLRPKWIAWALFGFEGFGYLFRELPSRGIPDVAYSAHLGGIFGAYIFFRLFYKPYSNVVSFETDPGFFQKISQKVFRGNKGKRVGITSFTVNVTNRSELKEEVDRILDKINTQGFNALTKEEKKTLDQAKDLLH
jgi:membrane associated rhomboid family serine protease